MVDIVTRESKGVSLTWEEMDSNWQNLNAGVEAAVVASELADADGASKVGYQAPGGVVGDVAGKLGGGC